MTDSTEDTAPADTAPESAPSFTIVSGEWANADHTAAVVISTERGAVAISPERTELWEALQAAITGGLVVAAFVEHVPAPPDEISDRQFFQGLAMRGMCSEVEALAAVATGTIPSAMAAFIDALPAADRFGARMILCGATVFSLKHPLTQAFAAMQGMTPSQLDDFWRFCAAL